MKKGLLYFVLLFCSQHYCNAQYFIPFINQSHKSAKDGNYDKSLKMLNKAIKHRPKNWLSYSERAEIYFKLKQYDNALNDINIAIQLNPQKYAFYLRKADIHFHNNQEDKAEETLNTCFRMDSTILEPYVLKTHFLLSNAQFDKAKDEIETIFRINEKYSPNQKFYIKSNAILYASCLINLNQNENAIEKLKPFLNDTSYRYVAYYYTALAQLRLKMFDASVENFNKSISFNKRDTLLKILSYAYLNDSINSSVLIEKWKNIDKNSSAFGRNYYTVVSFYSILNHKEKSLKYLEMLVQTDWEHYKWAAKDIDLLNIREEPKFRELILNKIH